MKAVNITDTALSTSKKGKFGTQQLNTERTNIKLVLTFHSPGADTPCFSLSFFIFFFETGFFFFGGRVFCAYV